MSKSIRKIVMFLFIIMAITMLFSCVKATTIKETTNTKDGNDTIEEGSIIIGVSKFTPNTVITGVRAAKAGANDALVYTSANGNSTNYSYPKMYYYLAGEWFEYSDAGKLKAVKENITSLDIYYVNNTKKEGINIPEKVEPIEKSKYTVFFINEGKQVDFKNVEEGASIANILTPIKENYTFQGWKDRAGNLFTTSTKVTGDMVVFAEWTENPKATVKFTVDGTTYREVTDYVGKSLTIGNPTKAEDSNASYAFAGWYTDAGEKYEVSTIPESNVEVHAEWNETFISNDDALLKQIVESAATGTTVELNSTNVVLSEDMTIPEGVEFKLNRDVVLTLAPGKNIVNNENLVNEEGTIKQQTNDDATIRDALGKTYVDEVVLIGNISLEEDTLTANTDKTIDLANNTITAPSGTVEKYAIINNADLTIKGGKITTGTVSENNKKNAIANTKTLTLDDVDIEGYYGVLSNGNGNSSTVTIKNGSTIKAYFAGVVLATDAKALVDNSTAEAHYYGLSGNGLESNAVMEITRSNIESEVDAAIYFPSTETLIVDNSTVTGYVGIEACAGNVTIKGTSTITSRAGRCYTDDQIKTKYDNVTGQTFVEGTESAASAIFFRVQNPYGKGTGTASVTVEDGATLKSENGGYGIRVYETTTATPDASVKSLTVTMKGTYDGNEANAVHIYKAGNNVPVEYLATSAANLAQMLNAGETAKLGDDIQLTDNLVINAGTTSNIDLNGHTITTTKTIDNKGTLTISGDGLIQTTEAGDHVITNEGTLTIEGNGTFDSQTHQKAVLLNKGGTVTINGGNFIRSKEKGESATESGGNSYYTVLNHGNMEINGGNFSLNGHFSSMLSNGYFNYNNPRDGINNPTLTIKGGKFSGGINTIKNDDGGILNISGGEFTAYTQACLMNWNVATITGGKFDGTNSKNKCAILNGKYDDTFGKGELTIRGGEFIVPSDGNVINKTTGTDLGILTVKKGSYTINTITGGDLSADYNGHIDYEQ